MTTPQSQAEAMSQAQLLMLEYSGRYGTPNEHAREFLKQSISAALSKLIAENERNKRNYEYYLEQFKVMRGRVLSAEESATSLQSQLTATEEQLSAFKSERNLLADYHTTAMCERDEAREQLTAMEAKLEKAQRLLTEAVEYKFMYQESADFDDGLPEQIRAFLSTLTAEKKESV